MKVSTTLVRRQGEDAIVQCSLCQRGTVLKVVEIRCHGTIPLRLCGECVNCLESTVVSTLPSGTEIIYDIEEQL